jgi:hypothetical protein
MDEENRRLVELPYGSGAIGGRLFVDYAPGRSEMKVPDCCYGRPEDFELAVDLVEDASGGLLEGIRKHLRESNG